MGCCEATNPNLSGVPDRRGWLTEGPSFDRRTALKTMAAAAGAAALSACTERGPAGAPTRVRLAFCGQLLCVIPYEVARARGHFAAEGLEVELVYTRGCNAAMQALVGGAVEYAGTSFDVVLQAANGAVIRRFASTGRLPLFALATAPSRSAQIDAVTDLTDTTVAISGPGNADHALLLFLLDQAGVDPERVRMATIGTNVFDALRLGQVDAAMVQEPALTLIVAALPDALIAGGDVAQLTGIIERYRLSLYPERVTVELEPAARVARAQEIAGILDAGRVNLASLLDTGIYESTN